MSLQLRSLVLVLASSFLCLPGLNAQTPYKIRTEISLIATLQGRTPVVHSYARAFLVNGTGDRVYKELIYAHQVADTSYGYRVYNFSTVSPIGYASSSTGDMLGEAGSCYEARVAAHSNDYNLHESLYTQEDCIPDLPEEPEVPKENCPVILDLGLDGFHLSGADPAVSFDIDADGVPNQIAWTRANDNDAFLCLDRNRNGLIDDGSELFGYATPLLSGQPAGIGYRAIAELDDLALGGNGDGRVDSADSVFGSLCVWNDRNRNGVSEPGELQAAAQVGLISLEYDYLKTRFRDSFGNLFRYVSLAQMRAPSGRPRPWPTYDVIFASGASD